MRFIFITILSLLFIQIAEAQKNVNVKLVLDKNVDIKRLYLFYDNGTKQVQILNLSDSLHGDTIIFNATNYALKFATEVSYYDPKTDKSSHYILFANKDNVLVKLSANKGKLTIQKISNAKIIYNSNQVTNSFIKEIETSKEYKTYRSSFLTRVIPNLPRQRLNSKIASVAAKYKNDYTTFWYFRSKVIELTLIICANDTTAIQSLDKTFKHLFPKKFLYSPEGMYAQTNLQTWGQRPFNEGDILPNFNAKGINNNTEQDIALANTNAKYTMLVFWATWCGPCVEEIPTIKEIYGLYQNSDKLRILSISLDREKNVWKKYVQENKLEWDNVLNENNTLSDLYRINYVPQILVLDKNRKVLKIFSGSTNKEILTQYINEITSHY